MYSQPPKPWPEVLAGRYELCSSFSKYVRMLVGDQEASPVSYSGCQPKSHSSALHHDRPCIRLRRSAQNRTYILHKRPIIILRRHRNQRIMRRAPSQCRRPRIPDPQVLRSLRRLGSNILRPIRQRINTFLARLRHDIVIILTNEVVPIHSRILWRPGIEKRYLVVFKGAFVLACVDEEGLVASQGKARSERSATGASSHNNVFIGCGT